MSALNLPAAKVTTSESDLKNRFGVSESNEAYSDYGHFYDTEQMSGATEIVGARNLPARNLKIVQNTAATNVPNTSVTPSDSKAKNLSRVVLEECQFEIDL